MRRKAADINVVVGQIEKSGTEIVRVIRLRLNGHELVSLPVFSCGRKSEKGLTLHLDQWRQVLPMIQRALDLELRAIKEPARRRPSAMIEGEQDETQPCLLPARRLPSKTLPGEPI